MPIMTVNGTFITINGNPIGIPSSTPASGWLPTDTTATLAGWWDADDAATITESSGLVSQWNDKSGNARHWTAASSFQPQTGIETINSKNVLTFDGTDDHMLMAGGPTSMNHNSMLFIVAEDDKWGVSLSKMLHFGQIAGGSFGSFQFMNDFFSPFKVTTFGHSGAGTTVLEVNGKALQVYCGYRNGTTQAVGFAGVYTTDTNASDATTIGSWILGATTTPGAAEAFDGKMAEVVWCNSYDLTERQKIEGYLAHKWGLVADLDAGHPYKSAPP